MGIRTLTTFTVMAMLSVSCGHAGRSAQVDGHPPAAHAMPASAVSQTRLAIGNDEFVPRLADLGEG